MINEKILSYVVNCIEFARSHYELTPNTMSEILKKSKLVEYLIDIYDLGHTTSLKYNAESIKTYLKCNFNIKIINENHPCDNWTFIWIKVVGVFIAAYNKYDINLNEMMIEMYKSDTFKRLENMEGILVRRGNLYVVEDFRREFEYKNIDVFNKERDDKNK